MNNDELLETYLDAFRKDPNTPVPAGLDPDLAAFVRALATAYPAESGMPEALQKRIWERALSAAMRTQTELPVPSANGRHHLSDRDSQRRPPMIYPTLTQRPSRPSPGLLTGAAALIMILFVGVFAVNLPFGSGGSGLTGLQSPSETATAIPTATLLPTNTLDSPVLISLGSTLRRDENGKQVFFTVDGVNPALISRLRIELRESQSQTLVYVGEVTSPPFELVAVTMDSLAVGWYRLEVTGLDAAGRAVSNTAILEFEHTPVSVAPLASVTATPIPFQPTVPPPSFEDATPSVLPFLIEGQLAADKPYRAYKFTATESGVVRLLAISKSFQPTLEFTISGNGGQGGGGGG
ncbi:MAG: hypothetical protein IAE83_21200, partial [Anaerolinea sp.]|nr:hypothetical protein [Anaerolinea sp.]